MKTYTFHMIARRNNALGVTFESKQTVTAKDKESAISKLYETWEHIRIIHTAEEATP